MRTPTLLVLAALPLLAGCDDTLFGVPRGGEVRDTGSAEGGFCAVRDLFHDWCTSCHSPAAGSQGDLDLETDPIDALVGEPSSQYAGAILVEPGDPDGSLLYRKVAGTQGPSEGGRMPPGAALPAGEVEVVRTWIADGATEACDEPADTGS